MHAGDSRRPFPQDIEMRCGFLGQLTSTSGIKPHPSLPPTSTDTVSKGGDILPPPEKKFALAGIKSLLLLLVLLLLLLLSLVLLLLFRYESKFEQQ